MPRSLRAVVTLDEHVDPAGVAAALRREDGFEIVRLARGEDERKAALAAAADLVVVGCDGDSERALALVGEAVAQRDGRPVVVLAAHSADGLLELLFAAGADDVITLPEDPARVAFAVEKVVARRRVPGAARAGRIVTVLGPKGGTGKTLLSTNLAVAFARAGRDATVVDLDLQFGDVALALGLEPKRTLYDLARAGGGLDPEKLDGYLVPHRSGAHALLAPLRPDEAATVGADLLRDVWRTLRTTQDMVVLDTAAGFSPELIAAVDASDDIVLVGTLDAGSLKDSKLGLETLALMGRSADDVVFVLNRAGSRVGLELRDVERVLGRAPDVLVPSDRAVARSLNEGTPIVESRSRSGAARALEELARVLLHRASPEPAVVDGRGRRRA